MPYWVNTLVGRGVPAIKLIDNWDESWGYRPDAFVNPYNRGESIPKHYFPKEGYPTKKLTRNPDLWFGQYTFCNETVKDTIEAIEPGVHFFSPFRLWKGLRSEDYKDIYILHVLNSVACIDLDQSHYLKTKTRDDGRLTVSLDSRAMRAEAEPVRLIQEQIKGLHLWRDFRLISALETFFISDEMHAAFSKINCKTLHFKQTK